MLDLSQLAKPAVIEALDFESILADRKAYLVSLFEPSQQSAVAAALALESEPMAKLLEENTYRELLLRQRVNEACYATMLAYATGTDLDHVAARWEVERLTVQEGDPEAVPPVPTIMESDERLRYRTQLAMEGLSVAGPRGAYEFHALSASARVLDAKVAGPDDLDSIPPGTVRIYLTSTDNANVPDTTLRATVANYLSADTRRPLGDTVQVLPAEIIDYTVNATLTLYPGPSEGLVLETARTDTEKLVASLFKIGYDVNLSALFGKLSAPGVQRVALASPSADLVMGINQAARCTSVTITIGGRNV